MEFPLRSCDYVVPPIYTILFCMHISLPATNACIQHYQSYGNRWYWGQVLCSRLACMNHSSHVCFHCMSTHLPAQWSPYTQKLVTGSTIKSFPEIQIHNIRWVFLTGQLYTLKVWNIISYCRHYNTIQQVLAVWGWTITQSIQPLYPSF